MNQESNKWEKFLKNLWVFWSDIPV